MSTRFLVVLAGLSIAACSSSDDAAAPDTRAGDIRQNDVWKNGVELNGVVSIYPGATVEIAPGATVKCTPGTKILVAGVLKKAAGARSRITCADWTGIVVAQGGVVDFDGMDVDNASVPIETTEGAGDSILQNSTLKSSLKPFLVGKKSKLTLTKVNAVAPAKPPENAISISDVFGTLVASYLDYDAGSNEGVSLKDGGEATITDSTLHGTNGFDMVSAYKGKTLKLSYSKLTGGHCGPHIQGLDSFEIDHVTSESNIYGLTIYAAGAGPNVIKDSNFAGTAAWLDLQGDHGPLTFTNIHYSGGKELITNTDPPSLPANAPAEITGASPR